MTDFGALQKKYWRHKLDFLLMYSPRFEMPSWSGHGFYIEPFPFSVDAIEFQKFWLDFLEKLLYYLSLRKQYEVIYNPLENIHAITLVIFLIFTDFSMFCGPRHTTNPSPLSIFWVQKITHKKLLNFFEKVDWKFKTSHHLSPKHLKRHYPLKIRPDFDLKELENFWFQKIFIFWPFSDIFKFYFQ